MTSHEMTTLVNQVNEIFNKVSRVARSNIKLEHNTNINGEPKNITTVELRFIDTESPEDFDIYVNGFERFSRRQHGKFNQISSSWEGSIKRYIETMRNEISTMYATAKNRARNNYSNLYH